MKNNMLCDVETGICGEGDQVTESITFTQPTPKIDIYYVTDPLCSHCWELEPVIQKLNAHYGSYFTMHYVMGGLLENWNDFSDPANGIQSPSDVASHWHEVGELYRMPISGKIWLKNPVQSSYPACIAYKLIDAIDADNALQFLRYARETVMVWNQNISQDDILIALINELGLDGKSIVEQIHTPQGKALLEQDQALAAQLGARGFPTIVFVNQKQQGIKVVGQRDYKTYEEILKQMIGAHALNKASQPALLDWLRSNGRLYAKEIEVMYDLAMNELVPFIQNHLSKEQYFFDEVLNELYLEAGKA